jgi:hypothetical protein
VHSLLDIESVGQKIPRKPFEDKESVIDHEGRQVHNQQAWERYIAAERQELEQRRSGHLARLLGNAMPGESQEELEQIALEDKRRAEAGLVELRRGEEVWHMHIDELTSEDRAARVEAEGAQIDWIAERQRRRLS